MRYIQKDFELTVDPAPPALPTVSTGSDSSYADFLMGARYLAPLTVTISGPVIAYGYSF